MTENQFAAVMILGVSKKACYFLGVLGHSSSADLECKEKGERVYHDYPMRDLNDKNTTRKMNASLIS